MAIYENEDNPKTGAEMYELAYEYIESLNGKPLNEELGGQWLIKAAENDCVEAMRNLGTFYFGDKYGKSIYGIPVDHKQGVYWLTKILVVGEDDGVRANAMTNLAICYLKGEGVPVNIENARQFCKDAAALGDSMAQDILSRYL